jgi:large subunit ribosomal protein L10
VPKAEKIERVAELTERIRGSEALLLTEYRGLTVADVTDLRRSLAEGDTRFSVVKNTLMRRAAADAEIAELVALLEGPTAVAFVAGDPVAAAKRVVDAQKRFPTLVLKGAWMEGKLLSADEAKELADLESREVMLSKIAGLLKGEITRMASALQALPSRFAGLLDAYREKVPPDSAAEASAAPVETETETAGPADAGAAVDGSADTEPTSSEEAPDERAPAEEETAVPEGTDEGTEG